MNKNTSLMLAIMAGLGQINTLPARNDGRVIIPAPARQNVSSGKSSKVTRKASGAASLKRAAKKRNNIRKHK